VLLSKVLNAESSKKARNTLETCYEGVEKVKNVKLQNLRRYFENLKMKDNESVVNKLRQYLSNKRVIEKDLQSFPNKFESVVVSREEFKDTTQMQIEELTSLLISHESRMSGYDDTDKIA